MRIKSLSILSLIFSVAYANISEICASSWTLSEHDSKEFRVLSFNINHDTLEAEVSIEYKGGKKGAFHAHLQPRHPEVTLYIDYNPTIHLGALIDALNSERKVLPQLFDFSADDGEEIFIDLVFSRNAPLYFSMNNPPIQFDHNYHCSYAQIAASFMGQDNLKTPISVFTFSHKRDAVLLPKKYFDDEGYIHSLSQVNYEYTDEEKAWHALHGITPPALETQEVTGATKEGLVMDPFWRGRKHQIEENKYLAGPNKYIYITDSDTYLLCKRRYAPSYIKPALTTVKPLACDKVGEFQVGRYYKLKKSETVYDRVIQTWKPFGFSGESVTLSAKQTPLSLIYTEEACRDFNMFTSYFEPVRAENFFIIPNPPIHIHFDHIDFRNEEHVRIFNKWQFLHISVDRLTLHDEGFSEVYQIGERTFRSYETLEKIDAINNWTVGTLSLINHSSPVGWRLEGFRKTDTTQSNQSRWLVDKWHNIVQTIVEFTRRNKVTNFELDLGNNDFDSYCYDRFDNRSIQWDRKKIFEPKILLKQNTVRINLSKTNYRLCRVLPDAQCKNVMFLGTRNASSYQWNDVMPLLENNKVNLIKLDVDGSAIPPERFFSLLSEMKNLQSFRAVDVAWSYQPIFSHSYSLQMAQSLAPLKMLKEVYIDLPIRFGFMAVSNRLDCDAKEALKKLKIETLRLYYPRVEVVGLWTREGLATELKASWGAR